MISSRLLTDTIGHELWVLLAPIVYIDNSDTRLRITADTGFYTDLLSIPAIVTPFISKWGRSAKAGVIHDALYSGKAKLSPAMQELYPNGLSRKQSDIILRKAARDLGESRVKCWAIYWGVRTGGWVAWNKYRKSDT